MPRRQNTTLPPNRGSLTLTSCTPMRFGPTQDKQLPSSAPNRRGNLETQRTRWLSWVNPNTALWSLTAYPRSQQPLSPSEKLLALSPHSVRRSTRRNRRLSDFRTRPVNPLQGRIEIRRKRIPAPAVKAGLKFGFLRSKFLSVMRILRWAPLLRVLTHLTLGKDAVQLQAPTLRIVPVMTDGSAGSGGGKVLYQRILSWWTAFSWGGS